MKKTTEKILNAASELYLEEGIGAEKVTMELVAQQADIARSTLYRHFATRDELLIALIEREARRIAQAIQKNLNEELEPGEYIIEGMVLAVEAISKNALFHYIFRSGEINASRLIFISDKITNVGLEIMLPIVNKADLPDLDMDFEDLMEWILRMLISFVSVPSPRIKTSSDLRKLLQKTMLPIISR